MQVRLTVELNGGSINQVFLNNYMSGETIPVIDPIKPGYDFNRWDVTGTGASINNRQLTIGSTNTVISALWDIANYRITYKDCGNNSFSGVHGNNSPSTYSYGTITNLVNPTKTGHVFAGWYEDSLCNNSSITNISATSQGNKTYYALWVSTALTRVEYGAGTTNTYDVPITGNYLIELWGAQGGDGQHSSGYSTAGGKGGYTSGIISLEKGMQLQFNVGGKGNTYSAGQTCGGYNGGGNCGVKSSGGTYMWGGGGGGATDVRVGGTDLSNRIMVAAGGGGSTFGAGSSYSSYGGGGGGLTGNNASNASSNGNAVGQGGTQLGGGSPGDDGASGTLGLGGNSKTNSSSGGGGGGYYGGGGGGGSTGTAGGGGSSFISGYTGCVTIGEYQFTETTMTPNTRSGGGLARITYQAS